MSLPGAALGLSALTALEALDVSWLGRSVSDDHQAKVDEQLRVRTFFTARLRTTFLLAGQPKTAQSVTTGFQPIGLTLKVLHCRHGSGGVFVGSNSNCFHIRAFSRRRSADGARQWGHWYVLT